MQKKIIFFVGAIVCLVVAGYGYYLYQKPRAGVEGSNAAYTITAANLYQAFVTDEAVASEKYVDKVLKVEGTIQQIDSSQGSISVILAANAAEGGVNCSLAANRDLPKVGEEVVVKGRCAGFLMDVSLVDAVLEEN